MAVWSALLLFMGSLSLAAVSSLVLANSINRIGARLHFSGVILGLVTAIGADSPEIATTATALMSGQHELGVGVIIGSNIFNIAAMLGLSALVAGYVRIGSRGLIFNGSVGFAVALVAVVMIFGWLAPWLGALLVFLIFVPYIVISAVRPTRLPRFIRRFLSKPLQEVERDVRKEKAKRNASWASNLAIIPAVASVIWASFGMVRAATALARAWHLSHLVVGTLILATLSGVPNLLTALQLARRGHGSAVVSETLNSNNVNVILGLCVVAVFSGIAQPSRDVLLSGLWLLGITLSALLLAIRRGGVRRWDGALLIAIYVAFVAFIAL